MAKGGMITVNSGVAQHMDWDFYPDATRIVISQPVAAPRAPANTTASQLPARFIIVLNWVEELKAKTKP